MTNLYDATVGRFLQTLGAAEGYLAKGRSHCESSGTDPDTFVETALRDDMFNFRLQVVSTAHHSFGAIKGVEAGVFTPPDMASKLDYSGLQNLISEARTSLEGYSVEAINALEDKDLEFHLGKNKLPFRGADFLLSFSIPNFYFHATTAYDILRHNGAPLGKRDFLGAMKMKGA